MFCPLPQSEGVEVETTDFGDEISGLLVREGMRAIIGVNATQALTRQRFTVAHELGHYLLHPHGRDLYVDKDFVVHFRDSNSSKGFDSQEVEANHFAAELLMPNDRVVREFVENQFDIDDEAALRRLAAAFDVSPIAMAIRLTTLGLAIGS